MLIAAVGYARYDFYLMDGDGTAFLDIAQALRSGHAGLAINAYWNPGYPAVLALAESLSKPTLWRELVTVRYANVAIFALAMAACLFFTTGLARARAMAAEATGYEAVSAPALHLLGLGLLTLSMARELPIAAPRADTLLLALLLLAMGLLLRLRTGAGLWAYPVLGLTLGCAYLTKSFAFLPSLALILGLLVYGFLRKGSGRGRIWLGAGLVAAAFALSAGPYIVAISRQVGHFSTGESARLNYAFFIDNTARWHEWYNHTLGRAGGRFLHPEAVVAGPPPVFCFAAHPYGTFPLWFDPAWWTAGLKPHIYLAGHLDRLLRNLQVFGRYLLDRPEPLVLLACFLVFGAAWPRLRRTDQWRASLWALAPAVWGLLMLGIYFPIDLQDRYLTGPFLLVVLSATALLRRAPAPPDEAESRPLGYTRQVATALVVLFAFLVLSPCATYLAERRRQTWPSQRDHPGISWQIFSAAGALDQLGLRPGDKIACMGDWACYTDHYWARLAGTQILAQIDTPNQANPRSVWDSIPDKQTVTEPLRKMRLRYIVTTFGNAAQQPEGWVQLGHSDFFAYPLQGPVSPEKARAVAQYWPQP